MSYNFPTKKKQIMTPGGVYIGPKFTLDFKNINGDTR